MGRQPAVEDVLPLTPLQEGLLFHASYDDGPDVYVVQTVVDLTGPVRPERLHEAVTRLLDRQPPLRASFRVLEQRGPVQVIQSAVRVPWREVDLSAEPPERVARAAAEVAREEWAHRFALDRAPLLRFTLLRLPQQRWRLLVVHHHILLDGWSMPLLMHELFRHYAGDRTQLPAAASARDYFAWVATRDQNLTHDAWRAELAGLTAGTMLAGPDGGRHGPAQEEVVVRLPEAASSALVAAGRRLGITLNTLVQTAWALLLAQWTGRDDVVFGATVAGRPPELPGIGEQLGLFVNTLPVRVPLPPAQPLGDLLSGLQHRQSQLSGHQHIGLTEVRRLAGVDGDLFDTVVVFENYPMDADAITLPDGIRVEAVDGRSPMHYPLSLIAEPGAQLTLRLGYRPDLFGADRVRCFGDRLTHLLAVLAHADPAVPLGRLDLLGAAARQQVLAAGTGPVAPAGPRPVPEAFAEQVVLRPDEVAVVCGPVSLTYAELALLVDEVTRTLREHGVGAEDLVAVCAPRGPELVAALLAVLRAGGAYLPLDPAYPPDRIAYLLADGRPVLLLTTGAVAATLPDGGPPRVLLPALTTAAT